MAMSDDQTFGMLMAGVIALVLTGIQGCHYTDKAADREATREEQQTKRDALKNGYCQTAVVGQTGFAWVKCSDSTVSPEAGR